MFCKLITEILFSIVLAHIDKIDDLDTSACIYFFRVYNISIKRMCEICTKVTIKTPERLSSVFIVNFEQTSHI